MHVQDCTRNTEQLIAIRTYSHTENIETKSAQLYPLKYDTAYMSFIISFHFYFHNKFNCIP